MHNSHPALDCFFVLQTCINIFKPRLDKLKHDSEFTVFNWLIVYNLFVQLVIPPKYKAKNESRFSRSYQGGLLLLLACCFWDSTHFFFFLLIIINSLTYISSFCYYSFFLWRTGLYNWLVKCFVHIFRHLHFCHGRKLALLFLILFSY